MRFSNYDPKGRNQIEPIKLFDTAQRLGKFRARPRPVQGAKFIGSMMVPVVTTTVRFPGRRSNDVVVLFSIPRQRGGKCTDLVLSQGSVERVQEVRSEAMVSREREKYSASLVL